MPLNLDIHVNLTFGDIRRSWVDIAQNFVKLHFISDGFMKVEGTFPNDTDINDLFKPVGVIEFHSPSEHTFVNEEHYDIEMEVLFEDKNGRQARASFFFDRTAGGNTQNSFIDALNLGTPGKDQIRNLQVPL